jgi:hypothetical protein
MLYVRNKKYIFVGLVSAFFPLALFLGFVWFSDRFISGCGGLGCIGIPLIMSAIFFVAGFIFGLTSISFLRKLLWMTLGIIVFIIPTVIPISPIFAEGLGESWFFLISWFAAVLIGHLIYLGMRRFIPKTIPVLFSYLVFPFSIIAVLVTVPLIGSFLSVEFRIHRDIDFAMESCNGEPICFSAIGDYFGKEIFSKDQCIKHNYSSACLYAIAAEKGSLRECVNFRDQRLGNSFSLRKCFKHVLRKSDNPGELCEKWKFTIYGDECTSELGSIEEETQSFYGLIYF